MFAVTRVITYIPVLKEFYPKVQDNSKLRKSEDIKEADVLFNNMKYEAAYEILNNYKLENDPEISWRICRALFKIANNSNLDEFKREVMEEAFNVLKTTDNSDNATLHKWRAIILDAKYGFDGMSSRVMHATEVRQHLQKSLELDPNDYAVLYMLGHWCYNMSSLKWLQRKIISFLYGSPPKSTYNEAYMYFTQAERLRPRFYIPNLLMLGKVCSHMNQPYRARYFLNVAAALTPKSDYESLCSYEAKRLENELEQYDVAREALVSDFAN